MLQLPPPPAWEAALVDNADRLSGAIAYYARTTVTCRTTARMGEVRRLAGELLVFPDHASHHWPDRRLDRIVGAVAFHLRHETVMLHRPHH